jgi:hypothetical protein
MTERRPGLVAARPLDSTLLRTQASHSEPAFCNRGASERARNDSQRPPQGQLACIGRTPANRHVFESRARIAFAR